MTQRVRTHSEREFLRRAKHRGAILKHLNEMHPMAVPASNIVTEWELKHPDTSEHLTLNEVKQHIDYLSGHNLVEYSSESPTPDSMWTAKITAYGIDYLDGIGQPLEGITLD